MVGGVAVGEFEDRYKERIGFTGPEEGVVGSFKVKQRLAADFAYQIEPPENVKAGDPFEVVVNVTNKAYMTDVGEVKLFAGGAVAGVKRLNSIRGNRRSCRSPSN